MVNKAIQLILILSISYCVFTQTNLQSTMLRTDVRDVIPDYDLIQKIEFGNNAMTLITNS
jgi:hypothetical protein